ncbi:adhesion G-protein coupled receptor G2-like [Seriola dumerili]|uniref:adhesion G-protein coupled receptor G2-like n=1 Tax=Seriola dumerili TaxID=41447 RepID=UPI000BBE6247|nr:adhesion G-protein coupled receptor G2-like [Seriola dumerili]
MVPLLLLLLLPESLADQICFNISNSNINITLPDGNIVENQAMGVNCKVDGQPCIFQCTFSNQTWFNGSSGCLDTKVTTFIDKNIYNIEPYSNCTQYFCKQSSISSLITPLDSLTADQREMMQLFYIRDSCAELFSTSHQVKKDFINAERQIIHNIMGTSRLENGGSKKYNLRVLSLNVVNISDAELNSTEPKIQIDAPQLLHENASFVPDIWLPVNDLHNIPKKDRIIGLVSYMQHNQFQFKQENISSMVLRIELLGEPLKNLKTPIQMIFRVSTHVHMDNDSRLQCCYFDEGEWLWKTNGCETNNTNQTDIICNCNHATPFAVLLIRNSIAEDHWKILSYLSYIGCSLSAFFTALSLVLYVFSRNHRMDYSISIHVSLSGALFMLNITFLLTEWGATVEPDWVCVFVAAVMHYSLLCCFTWMAIEALHLYLLLIKVFNTYYKHYMVKLSLAGWGIPGVIVAVSAGLQDFRQFYGVTQTTMANTNQTNAICWIKDDSFFYALNLVYFTLIFIFNSGILMAVASSICKMKQVLRNSLNLGRETEGKTHSNSQRFSDSCRNSLTVVALTCLMGTTWGLAFLGSGYVNYPILYLFCILNSTQGFFIFLWVCLSVKKQRKRDMEDRLSSTPVKTSGVKSD